VARRGHGKKRLRFVLVQRHGNRWRTPWNEVPLGSDRLMGFRPGAESYTGEQVNRTAGARRESRAGKRIAKKKKNPEPGGGVSAGIELHIGS